MTRLNRRSVFPVAVLLFSVIGVAIAQDKQIKQMPIKNTSAASGQEMFTEYCAACHGKDGRGEGPAASELKVRPPDLTTLAKRHNGKYADAYLMGVLRLGTKAPAHGTAEMPVWGPLFKSLSGHDDTIVAQRIANLTRYIESIQQK
jgi:mono/diheme cytochrome c family protein